MLFKTLIFVLLIAVVATLFSGLFFLARDRGQGRRTVRALTLRVSLSLLLLVTLMVGYWMGYLPFGR